MKIVVFMECEIANQIWCKVFKWLDLSFPLFNDVLELFIRIDFLRIKKKKECGRGYLYHDYLGVLSISEQCFVSNIQNA